MILKEPLEGGDIGQLQSGYRFGSRVIALPWASLVAAESNRGGWLRGMVDYTVSKLGAEDLAAFRFMAEVHESLPAAWIDHYVVEPRAVELSFAYLVEKHKVGEIACFVAESNGEIIAFVWAEVHEQEKEVLNIISLWTKPQYRGQGIATKLKLLVEDWAQAETSAKKIVTTVSARNRNMVQLNQKLGYQIEEHKMVKKL